MATCIKILDYSLFMVIFQYHATIINIAIKLQVNMLKIMVP